MRRFVLSPKWWAGHLLVAVAATVFVALGIWQWDRSQSVAGDFQNLGYALQWPLFAVFAVLAWGRWLWLESRGSYPDTDTDTDADAPPPPPPAPEDRRPPPVQEDESDDELAAYNAFLARLAERDRQR